jgi:hypothetical protein
LDVREVFPLSTGFWLARLGSDTSINVASSNAGSINVAFTKHITNALMKIRDEKLKQKTSIPKKLEDGWEPVTPQLL